MPVLVTFYVGNDITGGWGDMGGLNIEVQNGARKRVESRGPIWAVHLLSFPFTQIIFK